MDWRQKGARYGIVEQDNWLFQNVQDIRQSPKIHRGSNEKLRNGNDSGRKKSRLGENQERNISGRCTLTFTICHYDDATKSNN